MPKNMEIIDNNPVYNGQIAVRYSRLKYKVTQKLYPPEDWDKDISNMEWENDLIRALEQKEEIERKLYLTNCFAKKCQARIKEMTKK